MRDILHQPPEELCEEYSWIKQECYWHVFEVSSIVRTTLYSLYCTHYTLFTVLYVLHSTLELVPLILLQTIRTSVSSTPLREMVGPQEVIVNYT